MVPGLVERDRRANDHRLAAWLASEDRAQALPRTSPAYHLPVAPAARAIALFLLGYVARSLHAWSALRRPVKSSLGK